jgi:tRNA(adenine34) deaminase
MEQRNKANEETNDAIASDPLHDPDENDRFFMGFALNEARLAKDAGETPIGAVVVVDNQIVGSGRNCPIGANDPTAHAEIIALREAARRIGNYRLTEATLYVTIEPCAMCAGAIVNARIERLVYGAANLRAGGVDTIFQICTNSSLNHRVEVTSGVLAEESRLLIQTFFKGRRKNKSDDNPISGQNDERFEVASE